MGSTFNLTAGGSNGVKIVLDGFCNFATPPAHRDGTSLSEAKAYGNAATVGGIAIFAGGRYLYDSNGAHFTSVSNYYDASGTRTVGTPLSSARGHQMAASVGSIAIFAGGGNSAGTVSTADFYDSTGTRTTGTPLSTSQSYEGMAATFGDLAIFAGSGATVDFYDSNGVRTTGAPLGTARYAGAATAVGDLAIMAGGRVDWDKPSLAVVDYYEKNGTHSIGTPISVARASLTATSVGKLAFFAGGFSGSSEYSGNTVDTVDQYDENGTRSDGTSLSIVKNLMPSITVNDLAIFPGGGSPGGYNASAVVDYYNESGERTDGTPLTLARWNPQAAAVGNLAIVAGGGTNGQGSGYCADVDYYEYGGVNKTSIVIPANSKYRFDGIHSAEQSAAAPTPFSANQPISGYIKIGAQTLSGQQNGIGLFDA